MIKNHHENNELFKRWLTTTGPDADTVPGYDETDDSENEPEEDESEEE